MEGADVEQLPSLDGFDLLYIRANLDSTAEDCASQTKRRVAAAKIFVKQT